MVANSGERLTGDLLCQLCVISTRSSIHEVRMPDDSAKANAGVLHSPAFASGRSYRADPRTVGVIFISHSSHDDTQAVRIRDWLEDHGWRESFLDRDPARGIAPGQRWQEELKRAGERCAAVLVVISPAWVDSKWCQVEALVASQLGKHIFGVIVAPTPIAAPPIELAQYQLADISEPASEREGFERLYWDSSARGSIPGISRGRPPRSLAERRIAGFGRSKNWTRGSSSDARPRSPAGSTRFGGCATARQSACSSSSARPARESRAFSRRACWPGSGGTRTSFSSCQRSVQSVLR
jgi:hypothetical protein